MGTEVQLLRHLKETGEGIATLIRNFTKDSSIRKTRTYYQDRLGRLNTAWNDFEKADNQLRSLKDVDTSDEYFISDYYGKIQTMATKYIAVMERELDNLSQGSDNTKPQTKQLTKDLPETSMTQPQASPPGGHDGLISRCRGKMAALTRQLEDLQTQPGQDQSYYDVKSATITRLWQQLETLYDEVLDKYPDPDLAGFDLSKYVHLEQETQLAIIRLESSQPKSAIQSTHNKESTAKPTTLPLPTIAITKFNGDYMQWTSFADLFRKIIHEQQMSDAHKMWYLRTNVTGEAATLINHLTVTEDSYNMAWKLLEDRYNNKRIMVATAIQRMLDQPTGACTIGSIRRLHDTTKECLAALSNMGLQTNSWDPILLHLLIKKVDRTVHTQYENSITNPKELQTIDHFLAFLENYFHTLEAIGHKDKSSTYSGKACALTARPHQEIRRCSICKQDSHPLYRCKEFILLSPTNRLDHAQRHKLCVNCFSSNHLTKWCNIPGRCQKCGKKHHTLVHLEQSSHNTLVSTNQGKTSTKPAQITKGEQKCPIKQSTLQSTDHASSLLTTPTVEAESLTVSSVNKRPYILLGTALVKVQANDMEIECKAILDSGSQVNLITERLVARLGLPARATSISINGIGTNRTKIQHRVNITLQSRLNNFAARLEAFVLPQIIAPQPAQLLNIDKWSIPKNVTLADPTFNQPNKIDILLGAEYYHQLLAIGQIKIADDLPRLQNTLLGWIVSGKVSGQHLSTAVCGILSEDERLDMVVDRFWKLEEIESTHQQLSPVDAQCEAHFNQNTTRDKDGRFVVRLPFCTETSVLGESHSIAFNRFLSLERRLSKDAFLKEHYTKFMEEYEALGHMTKTDINKVDRAKYFIPHHCVIRPESSTTKLRVVFDASSKTSSGKSLNDILHTGPPLQNELFTILLRFRLPRFVFTTDIEKMYRQILIHPKDQLYQVILWRKNATEPISYFKLNTVTYGTRPAPYLAIRCLREIIHDNSLQFPLATSFLEKNFYVDDGLGGADSLNTALEIQRQLQQVMARYGFNLRKWCANHTQLLRNIPDSDQEVSLDLSTEETNYTKTLGLAWLPKCDQLKIKVNVPPIRSVTKRTVTSDLARIFDPLGLLSPVVVKAKMFVQELWTLNLSWDEAVPSEFDSRWRNFRNNLTELEKFHVHRHIYKGQMPHNTQLHVFTDASEKAYGAVIYVRTVLSDRTLIVHVLCAKSRIAPLKQQTLPRLELCAAQLGANLAAKVKMELDMTTTPTFYWTDSKIVLTWIHSRSSSFHTFVANRIASIQESTTPNQWRHVSSKDNPADIISRGLEPHQLLQTPQWIYGPFFLHGDEKHWPPTFCLDTNPTILEKKQQSINVLASVEAENPLDQINHRNSFKTLHRIVGYIFRFIKNAKTMKTERQTQPALTPLELHDALLIIVRTTQQIHFMDDIKQLRTQKELKGSSQIKSLSPFLDTNHILRVGGRLEASTLSYDAKHPMLLPYKDKIVRLIFKSIHEENKHCGPSALLANVRQRFWPIKGKHLARETVHGCILCARARPKLLQQIMGNLPETRVTPARPFINAGVDYCGPIWVHFKTRGKRPQKSYIAVFCCFSTKAVHLELVTDLTTDAFIGALKRFISRRGHCQNLYCDNATNFVGARNQLAELSSALFSPTSQTTIQRECAHKNINFHFIPPRAPHFGGLWEAAVKSAKRLLVKELANASLTYEEMETVVTEVEAILNSRPLVPLSSSPDDEAALTPGHFLIGEPLTAQVDPTTESRPMTLGKRWELVSRIKHQFWKRWSHEYLNELQQRNRWQTKSQNLQPGTIVLIKDNLPVLTWRLGKVIKTYPGPDGIVRTAEVKTSNGVIKRAIHSLAPLPSESPSTPAGQDETSKPSPTKRSNASRNICTGSPIPKRCNLATTTILMLLALIFPLILCQSVIYTPITGKPGLHFEQIGKIKPIMSEWKLLVYFELAPFHNELQLLANGTDALTRACESSHLDSHCHGLIHYFRDIKNEMEVGLENLSKRKKRGAIDVVGNIANSLFGVLDSKYADQMTDTINTIKSNEAYLLVMLRNQTSFLDSTLNLMKQTENRNKMNFAELNAKINALQNFTTSNHIHQSQLILSISTHLIIIANNLQKTHRSMINLLADTHHGRISPVLLTPTQFSNEVDNIRANLPSDLTLPVVNIMHIYGIVTAHALISDQHIICTMFIPLTHQTEYELFHVTPVPQLINSSLVAVTPKSTLIALNAHRDEYFPIDDTKLLECSTLEHNTYLCPKIQATYHKGAPICSCEIHLFNNESDTACNLEILADNNVWYKMFTPNQWIIATQEQLKLSTVCNGKGSYQILQGTGVLTLPAECTVKTDGITIYSHRTISSSLHQSYTNSGISFSNPVHNVENLTQPFHYQSSIEDIYRLQEEVKSQLRDLPALADHHKTHGLVVSYTGLALVLILLLVLLSKYLSRKKTNRQPTTPQPAPRSSWNISVDP